LVKGWGGIEKSQMGGGTRLKKDYDRVCGETVGTTSRRYRHRYAKIHIGGKKKKNNQIIEVVLGTQEGTRKDVKRSYRGLP